MQLRKQMHYWREEEFYEDKIIKRAPSCNEHHTGHDPARPITRLHCTLPRLAAVASWRPPTLFLGWWFKIMDFPHDGSLCFLDAVQLKNEMVVYKTDRCCFLDTVQLRNEMTVNKTGFFCLLDMMQLWNERYVVRLDRFLFPSFYNLYNTKFYFIICCYILHNRPRNILVTSKQTLNFVEFE